MRRVWLLTLTFGCVYIDQATFEEQVATLEEPSEDIPPPSDQGKDEDAGFELIGISGDEQVAVVDEPLGAPFTLEVRSDDVPIEGVTVSWDATGDADVPATSTTDAQGATQVLATLGTTAKQYIFTAELPDEGVDLTFSATAQADASIAQLELETHSGLDQEGLVSSPLEEPLVVVVRDRFENPVPDIEISWVPPSGASVSSSFTTTNADGLSQVQATLGEESGSYTFMAFLADGEGSGVSFEAWAQAYGG